MTRRLYYEDSHVRRFGAVVTSCTEAGTGWAVELDRTAFFPEGGGQPGDTGFLDDIRVTDTREEDGRILHVTEAPVPEGRAVKGEIDWDQRFRRMQNHSGEHVVSGTAPHVRKQGVNVHAIREAPHNRKAEFLIHLGTTIANGNLHRLVAVSFKGIFSNRSIRILIKGIPSGQNGRIPHRQGINIHAESAYRKQ